MSIKAGDIVEERCGGCGGTRNCEVLFYQHKKWDVETDAYTIRGGDIYILHQCSGCQHVFMTHESWDTENFDPETSNYITTKKYYPQIAKRNIPNFINMFYGVAFDVDLEIDGFIHRIFHEIYEAINSDLPTLAAMGSRALLDEVMNRLVGDIGGFNEKIKAMLEEGHISKRQQKVLSDVLELGHAAMHRGHIPEMRDVESALDVVENIVELVLYAEKKAARVKGNVPPRQNKKKVPNA